MAGPDYGALGKTFKIVRIFQAICMLCVIGMTANFISEMVKNNATPPSILIGTLSVICIAVLYCTITLILFFDGMLPFLITTGLDCLHLIAVIVVAVVVGKPLSYLDCKVIGEVSGQTSSAYAFANAIGESLAKEGGKISYTHWIGASKPNCLQMKAIWGFSIALCILFALSSTCNVCLWRRQKSAGPTKVDDVEY